MIDSSAEINNPVIRPEQKKLRVRRRLPGAVLSLLLLLLIGFFCWQLLRLKLLPTLLFAALVLVLLLFWGLVFLLSRDTARPGRFVTAVLLMLLTGAVCAGGSYISMRFTDTIRSMFRQDSTETVIMKVYVRADDPAESLSDIKGESLGILSRIDRSATEEMLSKTAKDLGDAPDTVEYNSPVQLLRALSQGQIRAIVMNEHYLTLLEENPALLSAIRALHSQTVIVIATTAVPETTKTAPRPVSDDPSAGIPPENQDSPQVPAFSDDLYLSAENNSFTVYLSGIDSRQGLVSRARSDVNIIAAVNPDTRQLVLISTPRDCAVLTPVSGDQPDTLTYTGNYGIDISRESLEMLYHMQLDYWFRVDFSGFVRIIDILGGIDINSDASFQTSDGAYYFRKGVNHVSGDAALAFARERKAFGGADQLRGPHQMEVIKATLRKASSSQILSSWDSLLSAVADCFEMTVPYDIIAGIVRKQLGQGADWNIVSYNLDGSYDIREIFSLYDPNYMFLPKEDSLRTARRLIWEVLNGQEVSAP